jgi:hypothetical protein
MATKMGFHGKIYYGAAGSTASTEITNSRDINYNIETEKAETTVRGTGTNPPQKTEDVVAVGTSIEWTMLEKADDTTLEALKVAVATGAPMAIRTKSHASGKGFDGDATLSMRHGKPLKGEQTLQFTASPTDSAGRAPDFHK